MSVQRIYVIVEDEINEGVDLISSFKDEGKALSAAVQRCKEAMERFKDSSAFDEDLTYEGALEDLEKIKEPKEKIKAVNEWLNNEEFRFTLAIESLVLQ